MATAVGIDLGTTNTVVAAVRDGRAAALPDVGGSPLIPSVVSFHPNGNVLVGRPAKDRRLIDGANTIYSVKRLIGRSWDSEEVRKARPRFPFEMRSGPGQAPLVVARGESYTLAEISAFVLRKAKGVAEAALEEDVERAVITVPANFNDLQRAATKVAARVAGIEVIRILNEPTAAALAYGFGKATSERIAVYDFGGGTFDVTLLDLSENVFEVLATAGDTFLGGDDIDVAIAERMSDSFLAQHRSDPRSDPQAFERLRAGAEELKIKLSSADEVRVTVPEVAHGRGGQSLDLTFAMTRREFEQLAAPIIDRTFSVCQQALETARLGPNAFGSVLLVGGSTRIPLVAARAGQFFKRDPLTHLNPDEVVAIGAAIQANALSTAERRRSDVPEPPKPSTRPRTGATLLGGAPMAAKGAALAAMGAPGAPSPVGPPGPPAPPLRRRAPSLADIDTAAHAPQTQPWEPQRAAPGAGPPPLGGAQMRSQQSTVLGFGDAPDTVTGLGPQGRTKTGAGLGMEADAARQALRHGPVVPPLPPAEPMPPLPPPTATRPHGPTLASAAEAAERARRAVAPEAQSFAAKYGNLPLIMPPDPPPAAAPADPFGLIDEPPAPMPEAPRAAGATGGAAPSIPLASIPFAQPAPPMPPELADADDDEFDLTAVRPSTRPPAQTNPFGSPPLAVPGLPGALPPPAVFAPPAAFAPPAVVSGGDAALRPREPTAPLLVDVTPLTLSVETVQGFCNPVITRNTPVPCERTMQFVTAVDDQPFVKVRISQGESSRFFENTPLGEIELMGLPKGRRGTVRIAVTFALDTNGMLDVSATDVASGRATTIQVRLIAVPGERDIAHMAARQAAFMPG